MSTNSGHCLNTLTVLKASCFPAARIQDDGPSCQSNVAKCQDKSCEKGLFSFHHRTKFDGTSVCSAVKNGSSHRINAPSKEDDDPVPKALIDAMDDRCWKHFTRSRLSKNVLITQRKYACQRRAISLKRLKFYRCQRGHHGSQDHISRQPVYLYPFALILFRSETGARLFAFFPLHLCLNVSTD